MSAPARSTGGRRKRGGRKLPPRYDTTRSSRPRIIEACRSEAAELGYENLKLSDLTRTAEISHQGFYIHFRNKRHAVAVATSDQLGAVADLVSRSSKEEAWAKRLEEEIDEALAEAYPSKNGPESRLMAKLIETIEQKSFNRTRIEELVRASGLGHAEFYRRYGGKKGCLQRIYGRALADLAAEIETTRRSDSLTALARALAADPSRSKLLVVGASYLPEDADPEPGVATRCSFRDFVGEMVAESIATPALHRHAIRGAVTEVIRSLALGEGLGSLGDQLEKLAPVAAGTGEAPHGAGELLVA